MQRWVVAVAALVGLTGCAVPVAGSPVPAPTPSAQPEVVRWMNDFCAVADYLAASGGVAFDQPPTDPAAARKSISDDLGRVVDVLDVALHDLTGLTPAPRPAADTAVELIREPLTRARDKFSAAKSTVDGAPELTTEVFSSVMQDMTGALTVMNEAVEKIGAVSLPDEFVAAAGQAENCAG